MMQKMLAERFHLTVHKESRILQVYAMSVDRSAIKFREATPGVEHTNPVVGSYSGSKITMAVLAQYLTTVVGTPVTDSTGLTGVYDVRLSFPTAIALPAALSDGLGLRLDKRKAPVDMPVVDHVENLPSHQERLAMNQLGVLASILAALAVAQAQQSNAPAVIETARKAALAFADSMPDFIVTRTTTRYRGVRMLISRNQTVMQQAQILNTNTDWQPLDTVSGNIATDHGKEIYSNIVLDGKPAATLPARGVWSQGEFSAALLAVLSPGSGAQFVAKGRDLIRNRRALRYTFAVDRVHSVWSLPAEAEARFSPAFDGTLWIDESSGQVLRITMSARGLADNYPSDTIESTIDYDLVKIADARYVLPVRSELLTCQRHGNLCFRNVSLFRDYKKFEADSSLTFEK
jgi:hypothetical protein